MIMMENNGEDGTEQTYKDISTTAAAAAAVAGYA